MKVFISSTLKFICAIIRIALIVIGNLGAVLSVLLMLLCVFGLLLNAVISGWDRAFDLTLMPLLVSVGSTLGFSLIGAIGKFRTENC